MKKFIPLFTTSLLFFAAACSTGPSTDKRIYVRPATAMFEGAPYESPTEVAEKVARDGFQRGMSVTFTRRGQRNSPILKSNACSMRLKQEGSNVSEVIDRCDVRFEYNDVYVEYFEDGRKKAQPINGPDFVCKPYLLPTHGPYGSYVTDTVNREVTCSNMGFVHK